MKGFYLLILTVFVSFGALAVCAQEGPPPGGRPFAPDQPESNRRMVLRRELGLSVEQMMAIRKINQEMRPKMRQAQLQAQVARKELDEAIYADSMNEELLHEKVKALVEADAEMTRLRTMSEVAVRKLLTPDQLVRFRQIRQRFARQQMQRRRRPMRDGSRQLRDQDRKGDEPPENDLL